MNQVIVANPDLVECRLLSQLTDGYKLHKITDTLVEVENGLHAIKDDERAHCVRDARAILIRLLNASEHRLCPLQ